MPAFIVDRFQAITGSAVGLSIPDGFNPNRAYVTVETASTRWRYDGGTPNAGIGGGHLANATETITLIGGIQIKNFKIIANSGTDAVMYYTLEGR